jgi:hypothetical protein
MKYEHLGQQFKLCEREGRFAEIEGRKVSLRLASPYADLIHSMHGY